MARKGSAKLTHRLSYCELPEDQDPGEEFEEYLACHGCGDNGEYFKEYPFEAM